MNLDTVRKLQQKKYRHEYGSFLAEGEHLVQELVQATAREPRLLASRIYCTREFAGVTDRLPVEVVNAVQMAQLSETRAPQGILAVVPILPPPAPRPGERAIHLHGVQDPGNLGTVLRTLAWFGGFRCLLGPGSVDVHNGKVVRASMGAIFHVPVEADVPLESLPTRFARIAALDLEGASPATPAFREFDCYVFGGEARGLPRDALDTLRATVFCVPGSGALESLNVASVVAMCQYELHRPMPA